MQLLMISAVSELFNRLNKIPHNSTHLQNRCCLKRCN